MAQQSYKKVLIVAGSDSGGGAGIQADIKTTSALKCFGTTAITALTAQNTQGVTAIEKVPGAFLEKQLEAILSDIGTDSVKIGMLHRTAIIKSLVKVLRLYNPPNIVLDPVMISTSGHHLLHPTSVKAIKEQLFPMATLITPNLQEAAYLLDSELSTEEMRINAAEKLHQMGAKNILIKGGDDDNTKEAVDLLYLGDQKEVIWLRTPKIATPNTHGTGCTLSSAIASYLAHGHSIVESVKLAKTFISEAIYAGQNYKLGQGHGPVHHFYSYWS